MFAVLIAFGAAVCITGYLAVIEIDDEASDAQIAPAAHAVAAKDRGVAGASAGPRPTPVTTEGGNRAEGAIAHEAELPRSAPVRSPPSAASRGATGDARAVAPGLPPRLLDARGDAGGPNAASDNGDAATRPLPPAQVPAETAVVPEPAPDRWQLMNAAIARCSTQGFFAGVICEQRERLRYCDGFWGDVPQCPGGIRIDYQR